MVSRLQESGHSAFVVGGAVRDLLLGVSPKDFDVATSATPEQVIKLFPGAQTVGAHFGVVIVRLNHEHVEVATFRSDGSYSDGRRPDSVTYSTPELDAQRRDFRMNALYATPDGEVFDPTGGGLDDIQNRRIIFVGDPETRIHEDYLRILRFFRMHAAYGSGEPDRAGYLACIAGRAGLASLSAERVRMEMLKLVVADGAAPAVQAMADAGLLLSISGGVTYTGPFTAMIAAPSSMKASGRSPKAR